MLHHIHAFIPSSVLSFLLLLLLPLLVRLRRRRRIQGTLLLVMQQVRAAVQLCAGVAVVLLQGVAVWLLGQVVLRVHWPHQRVADHGRGR